MRAVAPLLMFFLAACEQAPPPKPVPVTDDWERDPTTQAFINPTMIPTLSKKAAKACLCAHKNGPAASDECWSGFWKEVNEYRHTSPVSARCPGSRASVEFYKPRPENWRFDENVMTEFGYGACSKDEVAAKKAEYERKHGRGGCG